jgi:hypothetical protein
MKLENWRSQNCGPNTSAASPAARWAIVVVELPRPCIAVWCGDVGRLAGKQALQAGRR